MVLYELVILLCFSSALTISAARGTECGKNEVFSNCANCENTCQTNVPENCVCLQGCECVEGYKRDENDFKCVKKCPSASGGGAGLSVVSVLIGEPIEATKYIIKQTGKTLGGVIRNSFVLLQKSSIKIRNGITAVINLSVTKPTKALVLLIKTTGNYFVWVFKRLWNIFIAKPIYALKVIFSRAIFWLGDVIEELFELSGKITNKVYVLFLRTPVELVLEVTRISLRATAAIGQYITDILKAVLYDGYVYLVKIPLAIIVNVISGLTKISVGITDKIGQITFALINTVLRSTFSTLAGVGKVTGSIIRGTVKLTVELLSAVYGLTVKTPLRVFQGIFDWVITEALPRIFKKTTQIVEGFGRAFASLSEETRKDIKATLNIIYDLAVRLPLRKTLQFNNWLKRNVYPNVYRYFIAYPYQSIRKGFIAFGNAVGIISKLTAKSTKSLFTTLYILFVEKPTETFTGFYIWWKNNVNPFVREYFVRIPYELIQKTVRDSVWAVIFVLEKVNDIFVKLPIHFWEGIFDSVLQVFGVNSEGSSSSSEVTDSGENVKRGSVSAGIDFSHGESPLLAIINGKYGGKPGNSESPGNSYTVLS